MRVNRVWYLLKNRRYEGPFALEELSAQARKGVLSPDDYVIEESHFNKSQMSYRRAAEIVAREAFTMELSLPSQPELSPPSSSSGAGREVEPGPVMSTVHTNYQHHETVSSFSEGLSRLSFANVAGFCAVVLAATWLFNYQNSDSDRGASAEYAESESAGKPVKQQVIREVVRRDSDSPQENRPPVERLMPTERPNAVASQGPAPEPSRGPDPVPQAETDRGLASDGTANSIPQDPIVNQDLQDQYMERPVIQGEEPPTVNEEQIYQDEAGMEPAVVDVPVENEGY